MQFLNNLDYLLKSNDMKRADLARAIHVAPSTINSWYARGTDKVSLNVLLKISDYFGVTLEYLINGDKNTNLDVLKDNYTKDEIKLINDFCNMLKERRKK